MAVAQPSNEYGLWARVQTKAPWPTSDEDAIGRLAADYRSGARHFTAAGEHTLDPAAWQDQGGQAFAARARSDLDAAFRTAGDLDRVAGMTEAFASIVTGVKTDIRNTVEQNIPVYGTTFQLPAGTREAVQNLFVDTLADWSNSRVRYGAAQVSGRGPADNPVADGLRSASDALYQGKYDAIENTTGADPVGSTVAETLLLNAASARNIDHNAATLLDGKTPPVPVYISKERYPKSALHITEAQTGTSWRGDQQRPGTHPSQVTIDRDGANQNRKDSLRGVPRRTGFDRDEYPPAVFKEGGEGASVKYVPPSDNRGAGASMGNQLRAVEQSVQNQIDGGVVPVVDDLAEDRQVRLEVR